MGGKINISSVVEKEEEVVNEESLDNEITDFNFIIIGGGSAGLASAVYSARYGVKTLVADAVSGGALATSPMVENVPGISATSGKEIMDNMENQAKESGASILPENIKFIDKVDDYFLITTDSGKKVKSKKVLLATGNTHNKLGVKGEKEFLGKGVSYCATCDGNFYKDKNIAIVGGGNTALTEALYLSNICKEVTIIHRGNNFSAENGLIEKVKDKDNIKIIFNNEVSEIVGEEQHGVTGLKMKSGEMGYVQGVFIAIGTSPNTDLVKDLGVEKDDEGYLIVNKRQETNIDGLYAAGDNTDKNKNVKQTVTSAAEGVIAAISVHEDLLKSGEKLGDINSEISEKEKIIGYKNIESKDDFNNFINSGKKVSVTFSASWCPPCKILKSQLKQSTKEGLAVVDVDAHRDIVESLTEKFKSIPTTFIFENGKIIDTITGADYEGIINHL